MTCHHEDFPCCGCDPIDTVDLIPGDNCCPYCGDPDCFGDCDDVEDFEDFEREDNFRDDVEADADVLAMAGYGTDEDYGYYGDEGDDWG